jgi:DNA mismatch repair ATPase MutS
MKAFLMYRDHDFDLQGQLPWNQQVLIQDLELNTLINAMALGDAFLLDVAGKAVLTSLTDLDTILYRQSILRDCLKKPALVRDIYAMAIEAIANEKKAAWGVFSKYPPAILDRAITVLQLFVSLLRKLRTIADEQAGQFESEGFTRLFAMLQSELSDEYFAVIEDHLRELKFRRGVLISAELGKGHRGVNYMLRKPNGNKQGWRERLFTKKPPVYSFRIDDRDESGARALSELKDRGIHLAANALPKSCDHILSFFKMLRTELAFYIGCLNLQEQLTPLGEPLSFPVPGALEERRHTFDGLYDVCLALNLKQKIVGNTSTADGKHLVIITGANQGGKSTFLRSIGLAQLMMQCGMPVPAESFCANVCDGLFTHYKREEDTTMKSGKLDEELSRMSDIVDQLTPNAVVLFNESFAATNEREGSEIARQIISALIEQRLKVFYVTHLYDFAHSFFERKLADAMFLRAERQLDGERTFKVREGEPLQTSYGEDLYVKIFGTDS